MSAHVPPSPPLPEKAQNDLAPEEFRVVLTVIVVARISPLTLSAGALGRLSCVVQPGDVRQGMELSEGLMLVAETVQDYRAKVQKALFGPLGGRG